MDLSGFIDGYYSCNFNHPSANALGDQVNQLYNFNDKTDQFDLSAAKLTLNHDPDPIGAHVDFIYGRTNTLINAAPTNSTSADQLNYIEQAFLSLKPPKAKGFELDFGKFVTSAGAEVIEAKDNWNYSRSLLFVNAIPYWHFGARTSMPVSKTDTIGFQVVNGWNNVSKTNGGVTGVFTSAYTKPKSTWDLNYIVGPENANTTSGLRNLIDTTAAAHAARKVQRLHQLRLRPEPRRHCRAGRHQDRMTGRARQAHFTSRPTARTQSLYALNTSTIRTASRPALPSIFTKEPSPTNTSG